MRLINFKTRKGSILKINVKKTGEVITNLYDNNKEVINDALEKDLIQAVHDNLKASKKLTYVDANNQAIIDEKLLEEVALELTAALSLRGYPSITVEKVANTSTTVEEVIPEKVEEKQPQATTAKVENDPAKVEEVCNKLVALFKDCEENPMNSSRFINTMLLKAKNKKDVKDYIINYYDLQNSPDTATVRGLVKSPEFDTIYEILKDLKTSKKINNRLTVYYGPAGTGKTTRAIKENPTAKVIPCNYSMDCEDLFKVVTFKDGQIEYKDSPFIEAMQNGTAIILDEINLLNDNMIATLQTITDNKNSFTYGVKTYTIKEGFKIIGTMNLTVNGIIYPLRPALVDRCESIEHMKCNYKEIFSRAL